MHFHFVYNRQGKCREGASQARNCLLGTPRHLEQFTLELSPALALVNWTRITDKALPCALGSVPVARYLGSRLSTL